MQNIKVGAGSRAKLTVVGGESGRGSLVAWGHHFRAVGDEIAAIVSTPVNELKTPKGRKAARAHLERVAELCDQVPLGTGAGKMDLFQVELLTLLKEYADKGTQVSEDTIRAWAMALGGFVKGHLSAIVDQLERAR